MAFDYPSIDVNKKTNEQNIQATKSWAIEMVSQLSYQLGITTEKLNEYESRISDLESRVSDLEEGGD